MKLFFKKFLSELNKDDILSAMSLDLLFIQNLFSGGSKFSK